jgi:hypothetical protein
MLRTQTLDYVIVMEGVVELCLNSPETMLLGNNDIVVLRGGAHSWRNFSEDYPAGIAIIFLWAIKALCQAMLGESSIRGLGSVIL